MSDTTNKVSHAYVEAEKRLEDASFTAWAFTLMGNLPRPRHWKQHLQNNAPETIGESAVCWRLLQSWQKLKLFCHEMPVFLL